MEIFAPKENDMDVHQQQKICCKSIKNGPSQLKDFGLVTLGTILITVGVYFFKFPNHFSMGGVSGISVVLGAMLPHFSPGQLVLVINLVLLAVGFLFFGKGFGLKTAYSSILFSLSTALLEQAAPLSAPLTSQPLLELVFAVMLPAIGSAILFHADASSGGTDVVAMLLKKYTNLPIGNALMFSDAFITLSACFVFDLQTGLCSVLGLAAKALVVDSVLENINLSKSFTIITTRPQEICDYIFHSLGRGATVVDASGAFIHGQRTLILTAVRRVQAVKLQKLVRAVDPSAFLVITNTSEVIGKGFRGL